ncbi:MAG: hypothetical protein ACI4LC_01885 [Emergencia sp.]
MNTVGRIGRFIYENQELIWAGLMVFAVILAIVVIGKIVVSQRKKTELLKKIDRTVSEIHTTVGEIQGEKANESKGNGVIYIDNRSLKQDVGEQPAAVKEVMETVREAAASVEMAAAPETETGGEPQVVSKPSEEEIPVKEEPVEAEAEVTDVYEKPADETACESSGEDILQQQRNKFESRDYAVSRNGKSYTIEELEEQIK